MLHNRTAQIQYIYCRISNCYVWFKLYYDLFVIIKLKTLIFFFFGKPGLLSECLDRVEKCFQLRYAFFSGSHALFIGPASTLFSKKNFKTESHGTIHTFKNYFVTIFSVFSNKRCVMRFSVGPMHYS